MSYSAVKAFHNIVSQLNAVREIVSPTHWRIIIPGGFNYDAFNGNGSIQTWSAMRLLESTRALTFHKVNGQDKSFAELDEVYKTHLSFIVSAKFIVYPAMYDPSIKKGPLVVDSKLDYLSGKAMRAKSTLLTTLQNKPLCTLWLQSVFVNNDTRRADAPPKWWMDKYSAGLEQKESFRPARLTQPSDDSVMTYDLTVQPSDCDQYSHVNWSSFSKYCIDAWTYAKYKSQESPRNLAFDRNVESMTVAYFKEANPGHNLRVVFWKDQNQADLFHFQIFKDSQVLSEQSIAFFTSDSRNLQTSQL